MKLAMWTFILVWNLLDPGMLIYYGRKFINDPPRHMNNFRAYCTSRAMKSQDAWDFAQQCLGEVWLKAGITMACLAMLIQIMLPALQNIGTAIWLWFGVFFAELAANVATLVVVEVKLRQNFDKNGTRR